jgi:RimJ/RimL family protein N-acetyltransferase
VNRIIAVERNEEAVLWARAQMELEGPVGPCYTFSMVDENDDFVAVFIISDINGHGACIHYSARPGSYWMTPTFINALMRFAFFILGLSRLTAPIRSNNQRSMDVALKYGFVKEGVMRKAFDNGEDCILLGFLKEEFLTHRWFNRK